MTRSFNSKIVAACGIFLALTFVVTYFAIPVGIGYIHLGDVVIMLAAYSIGAYAVIPAALGAALADLALGYAIYIPATLVAKSLLVIIPVLFIRRTDKPLPRVIGFTLGTIAAQIVYFFTDFVFLGMGFVIVDILKLLIQPAASLPLGLVLIRLVGKHARRLLGTAEWTERT